MFGNFRVLIPYLLGRLFPKEKSDMHNVGAMPMLLSKSLLIDPVAFPKGKKREKEQEIKSLLQEDGWGLHLLMWHILKTSTCFLGMFRCGLAISGIRKYIYSIRLTYEKLNPEIKGARVFLNRIDEDIFGYFVNNKILCNGYLLQDIFKYSKNEIAEVLLNLSSVLFHKYSDELDKIKEDDYNRYKLFLKALDTYYFHI